MPPVIPIEIGNGYTHLAFEQLDSTNSECIRRANAGSGGKLWITAKNQTAGKARRGREWVSSDGNLFASLLLVGDVASRDTSTLPFVASLAVARAIDKSVSGSHPLPINIKWPNDVLFSGRKISGILLEATVLPNGKRALVIGCGINCRHAPDTTLFPATSLCKEGYDISAEIVFAALCEAMHHYLLIWDEGKGFAKIRQEWLERAAGVGEMITARFENHSETGKFVDIDRQGLLVLQTDGGEKLISAADIFFGIERKDGK